MPINIQDYLLGRIPVGRKIDIPAYLMAKAASGGSIKEITGVLPLTVRSRASQILENYTIHGTASGAGVETENLWDGSPESLIKRTVNTSGTVVNTMVISAPGTYTARCFIKLDSDVAYCYARMYNISNNTYGQIVYLSTPQSSSVPLQTITAAVDADNIMLIYDALGVGDFANTVSKFDKVQLCITKSSTPPSSYIPHGYKLPITVTSNGTTTDYPVYIGNSQLGEEEHVDYEEQKIYKLVDGVLTPTDPPVPLPDITIPQGEVTIDTEEELKPQATIKGRIEQIT